MSKGTCQIERCEKGDEEGGLGSEISAMFREVRLEEPMAELRGFELVPVSFGRHVPANRAMKRVVR
jgi:hypothetical protein